MLRRQTSKEDIRAAIAVFNKGHSMKEISTAARVVCTAAASHPATPWHRMSDSLPAAKLMTGGRKLISPRTFSVLKRQVDTHSSITASIVKETNSNLLGQGKCH